MSQSVFAAGFLSQFGHAQRSGLELESPGPLEYGVSLARQHGWDVLGLSDLHTSAGEVEIWENNSRTARRVQRDVSKAIVALEEFILVAGQRSGFLLSPAAAEAWRDSGCAKELSDHGRLLRQHINILDQRYDFVSGYAPTGDTQGRRDFFESASAFLSAARPHALQLWLGDWNGHVGRLSSAPSSVQGRFGLSTPTTAAGRELSQWLELSVSSGGRQLLSHWASGYLAARA